MEVVVEIFYSPKNRKISNSVVGAICANPKFSCMKFLTDIAYGFREDCILCGLSGC